MSISRSDFGIVVGAVIRHYNGRHNVFQTELLYEPARSKSAKLRRGNGSKSMG